MRGVMRAAFVSGSLVFMGDMIVRMVDRLRCSGQTKPRATIARLLFVVLVCAMPWQSMRALGAEVLMTQAAAGTADKAAGIAAENGLRLVMIEEEGCGFCARWHRDVGIGYDKTDEGRQAPLVRMEIASARAQKFERLVYTPTFLLVRDGREVGRIVGYAGPDLFWWQFSDLIRRHGRSARGAGGANSPPG